MKITHALVFLFGLNAFAAPTTNFDIASFSAKTLDGKAKSLADYKDKVLLIVNVASQCGYTPQYEGLEALHKKYSPRGLRVLGFPCNQFGGQEPGTSKDIRYFCDSKYKVTFDLFEKVDVNGDSAHPLFKALKTASPGVLGSESVKWNFTKFLVSKDGSKVARFGSSTTPKDLESEIEALLK